MVHDPARVPPTPCPRCTAPLDCASELPETGARPREGDLTICLYCGLLLEFDKELRLQRHVLPEWSLPRDTRERLDLYRRFRGKYESMFGPGWRKQ